jgi:hypothetical protein
MTTLLVLRLLHVITGILWGGTVVFSVVFLFPALQSAGPAAAGPVMAGLVQRRMMVALPLIALLTVASGLGLVWLASAGDLVAYAGSRSGRMFTSSGGVAIIAFAIGVTVSRPAGIEAGRIAARMPTVADETERERLVARLAILQRRNNLALKVVAVLVLVSSAGMAVARYA